MSSTIPAFQDYSVQDATTVRLHAVTSNPSLYEGAQEGYCGPAAVSAITGRSRQCANAWFNFVRGHNPRRVVRGSFQAEVRDVLRRLGYHCVKELGVNGPSNSCPTLAQWMKQRTPDQRRHTYLIGAGNHWLVVKGSRAVCSQTRQKVATRDSKKRRARVFLVLRVHPALDSWAQVVRSKRIDPLPRWEAWRARMLREFGRDYVRSHYPVRPYGISHERGVV